VEKSGKPSFLSLRLGKNIGGKPMGEEGRKEVKKVIFPTFFRGRDYMLIWFGKKWDANKKRGGGGGR